MTKGTDVKKPPRLSAGFYKAEGPQTKGPKVRHNQWRLIDFDGDTDLDLITGIEDWSYYGWDDARDENGKWLNGPLHGFVLVHINRGTNEEPVYDPPQKLVAGKKVVDVYGCPSPNFADFDGDGDLDLLCGEFLDGFTYFENTGTREVPKYAPGKQVRANDQSRLAMDLQMIVPIAFDWDQDGDMDLVVGDEDGRVALVENVTPDRSKKQGVMPVSCSLTTSNKKRDPQVWSLSNTLCSRLGQRSRLRHCLREYRTDTSSGLKSWRPQSRRTEMGSPQEDRSRWKTVPHHGNRNRKCSRASRGKMGLYDVASL
ncbi:MAG: FG-GAP-like repeat-containing protein [Pirellulales bacterium]